jgi:hypothetical protein
VHGADALHFMDLCYQLSLCNPAGPPVGELDAGQLLCLQVAFPSALLTCDFNTLVVCDANAAGPLAGVLDAGQLLHPEVAVFNIHCCVLCYQHTGFVLWLQGPQLVRLMLDSCSVMLLALHELLANNHHIAATITQVGSWQAVNLLEALAATAGLW